MYSNINSEVAHIINKKSTWGNSYRRVGRLSNAGSSNVALENNMCVYIPFKFSNVKI